MIRVPCDCHLLQTGLCMPCVYRAVKSTDANYPPVDSSVVAVLLHKAIGDQPGCVFVENGLLRWGR